MAKIIITNLNTLIDVKVTENVNVITANAASVNATTKAGEAAISAGVAESHKIAAASSVTASGVNADTATASAGVSTTQAGIATTQAGLAIAAKNSTDALYAAALDVLAETSKLYDNFDDIYLRGQSSDPIVDNDGNALLDGALYWNIISKEMKVYSLPSNTWMALKDVGSGALLTSSNLADLGNVGTARTNLDVYSKGELNAINILRADKYLAAQNIANMIYTTGNLTKIQYNTATDVNYEVLTYGVDGLSNIAHYINSVLVGNTVLTYTTGDLVSAVYTGV